MTPQTPTSTAIRGTRIHKGVKHVVEYPSIVAAAEGGFSTYAIRQAVRGRQSHHAGYKWEALTPIKESIPPRTAEVARLRNEGKTNEEIAAIMGITVGHVSCRASRAVSMGLTKTFARVRRDLKN
ncbi:MAG: RNA polymerase sigma factor [Aeromonas veronii]